MTPAALRRCCLAQPHAEETFPFGPETSVFKVGGKMFAVVGLEAKPLRVTLKSWAYGAKARLASGGTVTEGADKSVVFDLDVADALVLDAR